MASSRVRVRFQFLWLGPLAGITDGRLKWVGAPAVELYDPSEDPSETQNLAATRAEDVERLSALYRQTVTEDRRASALNDLTDQAQSQRLAERRSPGYVAGSRGDPRQQSELVDPKDAIATLGSINERASIELWPDLSRSP